ncbi:nickel import ATP-binding protein NikE [Dryocola sp. BD626]|uniref:nickel import ATP-binding protein NikE n=1 Tax=Dryocola sp. BD626 TaxID=3133273 RepID=UPI003F50AB83
MSLFDVKNVSHHYASCGMTGKTIVRPVLSDISLTLEAGETLALLGKSGCGKSTLARLLTGLEKPARGQVLYQGEDMHRLSRKAAKAFRQDVQMVFQDAVSAVNPRKTVDAILREPLRHLTGLGEALQTERIGQALRDVELDEGYLTKSPLQLSGGQLQRVCLARALVVQPRLIVLDESVSNLDLVLQARVIALLQKLRDELNVAFLFITHDLRLVKRFCQRVVIMDGGRIVESQAVCDGVTFSTPAGIALQQAVLPAYPSRRR